MLRSFFLQAVLAFIAGNVIPKVIDIWLISQISITFDFTKPVIIVGLAIFLGFLAKSNHV